MDLPVATLPFLWNALYFSAFLRLHFLFLQQAVLGVDSGAFQSALGNGAVPEPAAWGYNAGSVFAMLIHLVPLYRYKSHLRPSLPLKMEGHTPLPAYLLTSSTQQSKQHEPSECPGAHIEFEGIDIQPWWPWASEAVAHLNGELSFAFGQ